VLIFFRDCFDPEACQNVLEALAEILGETPLLFTIRTSEEGGNICHFPWRINRCLLHKCRKEQKGGSGGCGSNGKSGGEEKTGCRASKKKV